MGLRLQSVALYPVVLMIIVMKLYLCYHQDGLEFNFFFLIYNVAVNTACTVVSDMLELCDLRQIWGETSACRENPGLIQVEHNTSIKNIYIEYSTSCLQTEDNVHVFTECKTKCYLFY